MRVTFKRGKEGRVKAGIWTSQGGCEGLHGGGCGRLYRKLARMAQGRSRATLYHSSEAL